MYCPYRKNYLHTIYCIKCSFSYFGIDEPITSKIIISFPYLQHKWSRIKSRAASAAIFQNFLKTHAKKFFFTSLIIAKVVWIMDIKIASV